MRWLIPRLDRFHTERPEIEVAVTTATTLHDELRGGFDVPSGADRRSRMHGRNTRAVPFLDEADT